MEFYLTSIRIVLIKKTYSIQGSAVYAFIPVLGKQRRMDLCEFQATQEHIVCTCLKRWETEKVRDKRREMERDSEWDTERVRVHKRTIIHCRWEWKSVWIPWKSVWSPPQHTHTHTSTLDTDLQHYSATATLSPASLMEPPSLTACGTLSKFQETLSTTPLLFWTVREGALMSRAKVLLGQHDINHMLVTN